MWCILQAKSPFLAIPCAVMNKFLSLPKQAWFIFTSILSCCLFWVSFCLSFSCVYHMWKTCIMDFNWADFEIGPTINKWTFAANFFAVFAKRLSGLTIFVKLKVQPFEFVCPGLLKLSGWSTYFKPSVLFCHWFIILFLLGGVRRTKKVFYCCLHSSKSSGQHFEQTSVKRSWKNPKTCFVSQPSCWKGMMITSN